MAQYFYICSNSVNPTLRVELIKDGKYDFFKSHSFNNAIQNAEVTFSMWDENDILKISKEPCNIIFSEDTNCEQEYILEYQWKERDTKKKGTFTGRFEINFFGDLIEPSNNESFPNGKYVLPINEDLIITIK